MRSRCEALNCGCRLLSQSNLGVSERSQENKQDCRTRIQSIQRISQTILTRARSLPVGQKQRKSKAQSTLEDPRFVPTSFMVASFAIMSEAIADRVIQAQINET